MTSPRHLRRQARKMHRSGIQPMMLVGSSDQWPEATGAVVLRIAWRYRSELAPAFVAAGLMIAAWRLHASHAGRWQLVLSAAAVASWALGVFGVRLGLASWMERTYGAVVTLAAGVWLTIATAVGPGTAPLPQVLVLGGSALSVPWWAHRRRRAKVRVERKLDAWPEIAQAVGLPGSQVMSAVVDLWGWRCRIRLARGQTITDVIA